MCHVDVGDLPSGKSTWVVVRAPPGKEPIRYALCGPDNCTFPVSVIPCPAVRVLFGARFIAELEFLMHGGYPEKELSRHLSALGYEYDSLKLKHPVKVYAENQMLDTMSLMRDLIVQASLKYQVLSAETAFVAVRSEPGRAVEEQVIIPNALPFGWSESFVKSSSPTRIEMRSLPQGAGARHRSGVLDWVGGGESMDMIMQYDGTMKLNPRNSVSSARKSDYVIVQDIVPSQSQRKVVPPIFESQDGYRLFEGIPVFRNGEAVLFDSSKKEQAEKVPDSVVLKKLECIIKDMNSQTGTGLYLLLYIEDTAVPRVKVFMKDLLQQGGSRPLNIQRTHGELLKIILVDPDGEWSTKAPAMKLVVR
jgi:Ca-activated chloride channel family protein